MNLIKMETRKALSGRFFLASLGLGLAFALMSGIYMLKAYFADYGVMGIVRFVEENGGQTKDNILMTQNLYNSWIGGDKQSLGATLFYTLTPLLAVLPCGWAFCEELNSGYLHMIAFRRGRRPYFLAKLAASFLAGGLALVLPQLFSFLFSALFFPAVQPNILYNMYLPIDHGSMLSGLFYVHPMAYLAVLMAINFVFGGLFAWLSMAAAFFTRSRVAAIIVPFLLLLLADAAKSFLYYISYIEISPLNILHPMTPVNVIKGWVVLIWIAVLAAATVPIVLIKGCRREIF